MVWKQSSGTITGEANYNVHNIILGTIRRNQQDLVLMQPLSPAMTPQMET